MAQCPNCHSEVKDDERFCGNCGARISPSIPPPPISAPPVNEPPRPTGKETIVLPKITDLGMQPPTPAPSSTDATILATPTPPAMPAPPYQPPAGSPTQAGTPTTMLGSAPSVPPTQPPPPYGGGEVPPIYATPPAAKSGGSVWKILGIIVGIMVVLCVALSIGGYLVYRRAVTASGNLLATANAGLSDGTFATVSAGLETAVVGADLDPLATLEADATPEPAA